MDVTKHLTKPTPFALSDEDKSAGDASQKNLSSPLISDSSEPICSSSKGKMNSKKKRKRRDQWTRWPLMLDDVLKPEWTLEDEVAVVASQVTKARPHPLSELSPDDPPSDEDFVVLDLQLEDDDPDPPFYVPSLTYVVANFLSTILAELASYIPARPCSMQNRVEPLNWEAVVNAVITCGVPEHSNSRHVSSSFSTRRIVTYL